MRKCDVLYIHATKNPVSEDRTKYGIMPVGILAILNQLRSKGIDVIGVNLAIEFELNPRFELETLLKETEYRILMTDLHWYEHSFGAMYVAEQSKNIRPQVPTVIGGYTTTLFAEEIMQHFPAVDYAVTGDSDLPAELLTEALLGRSETATEDIPNVYYRRGTKVAAPRKTWVQTTLDEQDFISADFIDHAEHIPHLSISGINKKQPERWICVARGCKFNCAYCCGAKDNMKALFRRCNILTRSPEKLAEDFCRLQQQGIQVSPTHDFQMFGRKYYREVFAQIRKTGVKPGMYLECFQLPTREFVDEVANTFDKKQTILEISPISGNEKLRKENGKGFSNEELYERVHYIRSKGIKVQLYYTVNVVGETEEQFMDTFFQMKYLRMTYGMREIYYQRVVIDPLAGMRKWKGVNAEYNTFMDYYHYCQIPHTDKYTATGFHDGGQLPVEKKLQMYDSLFQK